MKDPSYLCLFVCIALLFAGCAYRPIEQTQELSTLPVPAAWEHALATEIELQSAPWLESLGDFQLVRFIEDAVERSFVLRSGMERVAQAEASVRLQGGGKFATLGLDVTHGMQENVSDVLGLVRTDMNSLVLSSSWELDLWGRMRKEQAATFAQLQASGFRYADLLLTMQSTVAKTWFATVEAKLQWELAIRMRDSFSRHLEHLEDRYRRGLVQAFDLRLFRAQSAANEAVAKQREAAFRELVMLLQSLASQVPHGEVSLPSSLPRVDRPVPVGLPSDVLLRRPDIRAAERLLASSLGVRDAASKNWLPSFRMTGSWGASSSDFGPLFDGDHWIKSIVGNVAAPLFLGGRLRAQRELTEAQFQEQLNQYSQSIVDAIREVETALMRDALLATVEPVIEQSSVEVELAERQAWELYDRGLIDITSALDSQRRSVSAQSELLAIRNQRLQNRIDLHVALGGGFELDQELVIEEN